MLEIVKYTNKTNIEYCSKFSDLFLKEYYINIISYDEIMELCKFNNPKIISRNIKDKANIYYVIRYNKEIIGYVLAEMQSEALIISEIFILKRYRKKGFLKEIIKEIKSIVLENNLKNINIFISESKKSVQKIFEKLGFIRKDNIAKYVGDDIYIYNIEYCMKL